MKEMQMGLMGDLITATRESLAHRRAPQSPGRLVRWWVDLPTGRRLSAEGQTRSEARADAKRTLGVSRLPPGTTLVRV